METYGMNMNMSLLSMNKARSEIRSTVYLLFGGNSVFVKFIPKIALFQHEISAK